MLDSDRQMLMRLLLFWMLFSMGGMEGFYIASGHHAIRFLELICISYGEVSNQHARHSLLPHSSRLHFLHLHAADDLCVVPGPHIVSRVFVLFQILVTPLSLPLDSIKRGLVPTT